MERKDAKSNVWTYKSFKLGFWNYSWKILDNGRQFFWEPTAWGRSYIKMMGRTASVCNVRQYLLDIISFWNVFRIPKVSSVWASRPREGLKFYFSLLSSSKFSVLTVSSLQVPILIFQFSTEKAHRRLWQFATVLRSGCRGINCQNRQPSPRRYNSAQTKLYSSSKLHSFYSVLLSLWSRIVPMPLYLELRWQLYRICKLLDRISTCFNRSISCCCRKVLSGR